MIGPLIRRTFVAMLILVCGLWVSRDWQAPEQLLAFRLSLWIGGLVVGYGAFAAWLWRGVRRWRWFFRWPLFVYAVFFGFIAIALLILGTPDFATRVQSVPSFSAGSPNPPPPPDKT